MSLLIDSPAAARRLFWCRRPSPAGCGPVLRVLCLLCSRRIKALFPAFWARPPADRLIPPPVQQNATQRNLEASTAICAGMMPADSCAALVGGAAGMESPAPTLLVPFPLLRSDDPPPARPSADLPDLPYPFCPCLTSVKSILTSLDDCDMIIWEKIIIYSGISKCIDLSMFYLLLILNPAVLLFLYVLFYTIKSLAENAREIQFCKFTLPILHFLLLRIRPSLPDISLPYLLECLNRKGLTAVRQRPERLCIRKNSSLRRSLLQD